jgi:hypothetical protein
MRLFHVSEESDIKIFHPIKPYRKDLAQEEGLVWALCERTLPNFLTPRNCPRVTFHVSKDTKQKDINKYFKNKSSEHAVYVEKDWLERIDQTTLTIYEFNPKNFVIQDEMAGYYVSTQSEVPIKTYKVTNLRKALKAFDVEFHAVDFLWDIMEQIQQSSFNWSMCRMGLAKKKHSE